MPKRSVLEGSPAHTLLVLPLNVTVVMPAELESSSPVVWKELELYLSAHGKKLKTVAFPVARLLWAQSIQRARSGEKGRRAGFDAAARLLVLELSRHADFDIVIVPSLFVQEAAFSGTRARFDGVERELDYEAYGREAKEIAARAPVEGAAPAASLHAVVLDAQGNKLQEGQGGLDLLVDVLVRTSRDGVAEPSFDFETRTDVFANRDHVREGIEAALAPFLPPLARGTE